MTVRETYKLFTTIIRNYQTLKPLEYQEILLKCPSLKIELNDSDQHFHVIRNNTNYIKNDSIFGGTLFLCGIRYDYEDWSHSNNARIHFRCSDDLHRRRYLTEYNIASQYYNDANINRTFITRIVCPMFEMYHTENYSNLSFPNPFYKE